MSCQGASGLDIAAFVSVLEEANRQAGDRALYEISIVRFEDQSATACPDYASTKPLETLVVAAPADYERNAFRRDTVRSFECAVASADRIVALGGGTFLLASLGLLNAGRVVVHWSMQDRFRKRFPVLTSDGEALYAEDGRLITCAGGVASIDCALALVEKDLGCRVAGEVARVLLLPYRRGSDAAQMSSLLRSQLSTPDRFSQMLAWLPDHLQEDLSIRALAKRAAMSTRNFARVFHKRMEMTPALYVEHLRLQAAQRELCRSCASLPQIAEVSGFHTPETLRRVFLKHMGMTPGSFRRNHGHAAKEQLPSRKLTLVPLPEYSLGLKSPLPFPDPTRGDGTVSM